MDDVMVPTQQPRGREASREVAVERVVGFAQQFGEAYLTLACHAAFPLVLTPDLLYRLWANFVPQAPWTAVADVLLSPLCREVGYELYEMDVAVRNLLLQELKDDERFGQQRLNELADFLKDYVAQQLYSDDPDTRDLAQAQRWTALAYTQPGEAAHELALTLSELVQEGGMDLLRVALLAETFAEPLAQFDPLLTYARGMADLARDDIERATMQFGKMLGPGHQVQVAGFNLPIPTEILASLHLQPPGVFADEALDQFILANMPHFIAVRYEEMLEAETWPERVHEALCVFELGLRVLALSLVSQYLTRDAEKVSDPELNDLLLRRLPTATLGVWEDILFTALRAYEGQRRLLFMPELYDFFWDSSVIPPRPRPDIGAPLTRLVQIHSDLAVREFPADERGWKQLGEETLRLLRTVLAQFAFLERYELIRITGHDEAGYHYVRYIGVQPKRGETPLDVSETLNEGSFYLSKDKRAFLELHPLLIFWQEPSQGLIPAREGSDGVAIYEGYMRDTVVYLVAALWEKISISDSEIVGKFIQRVWAILETVKLKRLETTHLTWWQLQKVARAISERRMAGVRGKYRAHLYLQRDATKAAFDRFLASDKTCFVLIGKSGVGKSNFLLALAEEYHAKHPEVCLLMYNGANLDPTQNLTATVNADFENYLHLTKRREEGIDNIWLEIERVEGIEDRRVVLVIDAINENKDGRALLRQINELVESSPWTWLRVVVTSRPEAWRNIKSGLTLAEGRYYREVGGVDLGTEMQPFTYSQELGPFEPDELPRVYEKYRQVYGLQTTYEWLTVEIKEALRDPLMLWLVAESHRAGEIPAAIRSREIYEDYVNALIKTGRMHLNDVRFLEKELMPWMIRQHEPSSTIPARVISVAQTSDGRSLYTLIHSDHILSNGQRVNQSYINLVDAGILEQRGGPLDYEIGFRYEHLYDYFAGKSIFELSETQANRFAFFLDMISNAIKMPFLWGAVKNALIYHAEGGGTEIILDLCFTEQQRIKEMMIEVLVDFGYSNRAEVEDILKSLVTREEKGGLFRNARQLFSRPAVSSDIRSRNARVIAIEVASHLDISLSAANSRVLDGSDS